MNRISNEQREHIVREAIAQRDAILAGNAPRKLWLWRNFVDGKPEYWAFDNPYPIHLSDGDPQTLGEPCGYAIFKPSRNGRPEVSEEQVLRAVLAASSPPQGGAEREVIAYHDKDQPNGIAWCPGYPDKLPDIVPLYAGKLTSKRLRNKAAAIEGSAEPTAARKKSAGEAEGEALARMLRHPGWGKVIVVGEDERAASEGSAEADPVWPYALDDASGVGIPQGGHDAEI